MDPTISKLVRDKRFQLAAAGVAAVGLGVWWQRRHANSSAAQPSGQMVSGGQGLGSFDSTGADVAAQLGEQTGQIQDVLQQFLNQLQGTLAGAGQIPTAPTPSPTSSPTPSPPPRRTTGPVTLPVPGAGPPRRVPVSWANL